MVQWGYPSNGTTPHYGHYCQPSVEPVAVNQLDIERRNEV